MAKWGDIQADADPSAIIQFTKQYVATADATVTNTTVESSLLSTTYQGVGKTLAANKLSVGSVIRVRVGGVYSIPAALGGSLVVRLKLSSTTLASVTISSTLLGLLLQTDQTFDLSVSIVVRAAGANGSVAVTGSVNFMTTATAAPQTVKLQSNNVVTGINTTTGNDIDVTAQWSSASTSRSIKATVATINVED